MPGRRPELYRRSCSLRKRIGFCSHAIPFPHGVVSTTCLLSFKVVCPPRPPASAFFCAVLLSAEHNVVSELSQQAQGQRPALFPAGPQGR